MDTVPSGLREQEEGPERWEMERCDRGGPVWQEQADEQQEEAEEEELSYQNSYWKVDDQVLLRDRNVFIDNLRFKYICWILKKKKRYKAFLEKSSQHLWKATSGQEFQNHTSLLKCSVIWILKRYIEAWRSHYPTLCDLFTSYLPSQGRGFSDLVGISKVTAQIEDFTCVQCFYIQGARDTRVVDG